MTTHSEQIRAAVPTGPLPEPDINVRINANTPPANAQLEAGQPVTVSGTTSALRATVRSVTLWLVPTAGGASLVLGSAAPTSGNSWSTWTATLVVPGAAFGAYNLEADAAGVTLVGSEPLDASDARAVQVANHLPPTIEVGNAAALSNVPVAAGQKGVTVNVTGTAHDPGSGVKSVECSLDNGPFGAATLTPPSGQSVSFVSAPLTIPLDPQQRTAHTVTIRCTDNAGNVATQAISVAATDATAPTVTPTNYFDASGKAITPDTQGILSVPGTDTGGILTVTGSAADRESTVRSVEWSVDPPDGSGQFSPATGTAANWSTWSANVPIPPFGKHTVLLRCTDAYGNVGTARLTAQVVVSVPWQKIDLTDPVSPWAYLVDLLNYSHNQISGLTTGYEQRNFYQPVDDARLKSYTPVRQVRLAVEVLRKYLASLTAAATNGFGWVDDAVPYGATQLVAGDSWSWVSSNPSPRSGTQAHQSAILAGAHQHFFTNAAYPLPIRTGDLLFCYVFLDPANPPTEIMLQWDAGPAGGGWEHRAFWGADQLAWGVAGQSSRRNMGALPAAGTWVRLDVPAAQVGLEGQRVIGMAFSLSNGRATWDLAGKLPASHTSTADILQRLAVAEAAYRTATYEQLLVNVGTSYAELRLARQADASTRAALAARLGISLLPAGTPAGSRPDRLDPDGLLLLPSQVTEAAIEQRFGLASTTRDPLGPPAPAQLLQWQQQHLRERWQAEDHPAPPAQLPRPVIVDPDLVQASDLPATAPGVYNPARDLWTGRSQWASAQLALLAQDQVTGETDAARLDRLIDKTVPGGLAQLQAIDTKRKAGQDVSVDLAAAGLAADGLDYLLRLRALTTSPLLDSEWADAYSILFQVLKSTQFATWRVEEAALTLSPDFFAVPDQQAADAATNLPAWRASRAARQAWLDALTARADQDRALQAALAAAVDAAEEATLPQLRDALVAAIAALTSVTPAADTNLDLLATANALSQRLLIDARDTGRRLTTRIDQAIETAQDLAFSVRASRFPPVATDQLGLTANPFAVPGQAPLALRGTDPVASARDFDQEWTWMGSYAAWRAAMRVFLYPEALLLPSLWGGATQSFNALIRATRDLGPSLSVSRAQDLATTYVQNLAAELAADPNTAVGDPNARTQLMADLRSLPFTSAAGITAQALVQRAQSIQRIYGTYSTNPAQLRYVQEYFYFAPMHIALQLQAARQFAAAIDWFRTVYASELPRDQRKIYYGLRVEEGTLSDSDYTRSQQWPLNALDPHNVAVGRRNTYTRYTLLSLAGCLVENADAEFTADTLDSITRARDLYLLVLDLLDPTGREWLPPTFTADPTHSLAPSPAMLALLQRAQLNLRKLRSSRNIAGLERQLEPNRSSSGDDVMLSAGGTLVLRSTSYTPTPYRYTTLIERAKQLVALAQQMELQYLNALEKQEAETYNLLKATQDLELAGATIKLQQLQSREATAGVDLAMLQQQRAQASVDHYTGLVNQGLSGLEQASLDLSGAAAGLQLAAAGTSFLAAILPASISESVSVGFPSGASASFSVSESPQGSAMAVAGGLSNLAAAASTGASILATRASYERRQQEWAFQAAQAQQDVLISQQQGTIARDHADVVGQQLQIAQLQDDHARATVNFLANKFLNAELYQWMSGVLGSVYGYLLQQAASVARLAQNQLAFERQEEPASFIQADYWQQPSGPGDSQSNAGADRRGLTGSARLLQDIVQLDQYAFQTNARKLQIVKSISLAQLAPAEFQHFRDSGVLEFATPMALFDRDFPGHYLRLIKRVRTSVVALVPPSQGIRATLSSSGVSRVTLGGPTYPMVVSRRDPETVALSSPINATGVFELDAQPDMLLPFEGNGVDTMWRLEMPKAANFFDFRSIGDVLFTIEYTALNSLEYRDRVVRHLDRSLSADRVFSLRQEFADRWYDLHNADAAAPAISVQLTTVREAFPPNLDQLRIQHVLVYYVSGAADLLHFPTTTLQLQVDGNIYGGAANPVDGLISTRRSNGVAWLPMLNNSPVGTWQLSLPNSPETRQMLLDEQLDDILLLVTYAGQTPPWPMT